MAMYKGWEKFAASYRGRKNTENDNGDDENYTKYVGRVSLSNHSRLKLNRKNSRLLDAVESGDVERISRLLKLEASPNATCQLHGVSACHIAAMMDNESLIMLIAAGAHSFRKDELGRIPLHFAAWAGKPRQIAVLLGFSENLQNRVTDKITPKTELEIKEKCVQKSNVINIACDVDEWQELPKIWNDSMEHNCGQFNKNLPEIETGWTALHLASARAHYSCVQLLLAAGADPGAPDCVGRTPLDVVGAAHYLGFTIDITQFNDIIKILTAAGGKMLTLHKMRSESKGEHIYESETYRDDIFSSPTENTLLHTAVELESQESIKYLLHSDVSAMCLNKDGLTALHICVNKRLKDHLQLIADFEYSNENASIGVIDAKDINGLTVLGAAVRAKWIDGVRIALGAGANVFVQGNDGDSPFHTAAALGDDEIFRTLLTIAKYCIDSPNQRGQTALFVAIAHNHLDIVKLLIKHGASFVNKLPSGENLNVLHVAAEYGRTEILTFLLNCSVCHEKQLIDDITCVSRRNPIFYAVLNNHVKCVSLLLKYHVKVDNLLPFKDGACETKHTTILHVAAAENYIDIAKLLLEFDGEIINKRNSACLLPLHEACMHSNRDMITLLLDKGADLSAEHPRVKTPIQMLMNNLSKPTSYLEEIFDSYITTCSLNLQNKDCKVNVDYRVLLRNEMEEIKVIKALVDTGNRYCQKRLLHHPLIESFLYLKWKSLLPFFYIIVGLYGCFVVSFNMYVMTKFYDFDKNLTAVNCTKLEDRPILYHENTWKILTYVTGGLITIQIISIKIIIEKYNLFFLETFIKFIATMSALALPSVISVFGSESEFTRGATCIAVLLSWLEMMFLLCRFPKWGFYVLMFGNVTAKVLKVLLTFGFLIIGFSICFMIQFRSKPPFETLWASVTKTLVMMTSEYDYSSTIENKHAEGMIVHLSILRIIFVAFVILASIVLMNLMIGVAVNDVNNLEEIGNRTRLQKQVDFLSSLEGVDKYIRKIIPKRYYNVSIFTEDKVITLRPHKQLCKYYKILPIHIREGIFEKAQSRNKQAVDEICSVALKKRLDEIQFSLIKQDEKLDQVTMDIMKKIHDMKSAK